MKVAKLVTGILCMVLFLFIVFQSCAVGVSTTLTENTSDTSGAAGIFVAVLMLTGGIVQVATRKSEKKGGSVACAIIFILAALLGFANAGVFADLNIWSWFCVILAVMNILCLFGKKKAD